MHKASRIIEALAQAICNGLLILILVLVFTEVISRYIFSQSHGSMEAIAKYSQIWIAFLAMGVVEKSRGHIKADVIFIRLPVKVQTGLMVGYDLITLTFCLALFKSGYDAASTWYSLGYSSSSGLSYPLWIVMLAVPLGAVMLAFFGLEHLIRDIKALRQPAGTGQEG